VGDALAAVAGDPPRDRTVLGQVGERARPAACKGPTPGLGHQEGELCRILRVSHDLGRGCRQGAENCSGDAGRGGTVLPEQDIEADDGRGAVQAPLQKALARTSRLQDQAAAAGRPDQRVADGRTRRQDA
jgi:hypothetical protein